MRIFSLDKAAQGFSVPALRDKEGVHEVHRNREPAENEVQRKKDHVWMDTI